MEKIDPKLLKGLKYHDHEAKDVVEDGRKVRKYVPTERPLRPDDIIGMRDAGESIIIVTGDGKRYTLSKKGD